MNDRTAFYIPNLGGGGAQRVVVNLASWYAEKGRGVDLVAADASGPLLDEVPRGVRLIDLGAGGVFGSLPGLVRYIRRERPAAMLSTMSHCNVVAVMARMLSRARMRLVLREANTLTFHRHRKVSARERAVYYLMMALYARADMVVANSIDTASDLVAHGMTDEDGVIVIHNPIVSRSLFEKQSEEIEHPWFDEGDIPVVAGVGRLHPQKDFETMIRAFGRVRKKRSARLLILGEGSERKRLLAIVRDLGLEDDVDLPGYVPNPHPYIARASLLALSSRWEGFGNVLVEALAAGTPVVSTRCPGGPVEILDHGMFGRLVPVGDEGSLAEAILDTLDDPGDREALIERANDFSVDNITTRYAEILSPDSP